MGKHPSFLFFLLIAFTFFSCGSNDSRILIDGHLLNINQADFLVYSTDGAIAGVDTIHVRGGRFTYEGTCLHKGSIAILMPNGTSLPVFVTPGDKLSIDGNAQQLGAVEIEGNDENEVMNEFRKLTVSRPATANMAQQVKQVILDHPASPVGEYLVQRYILESKNPDYVTARYLIAQMQEARPDAPSLTMMASLTADLQKAGRGAMLPAFDVTDTKGKTFSAADLRKGIFLFCVIASWDYESINQMRRMKEANNDRETPFHIIALSVDASKRNLHYSIMEDPNLSYVCDEEMMDSPVLKKLMLTQTGTGIVVNNGTITYRGPLDLELQKKLRKG